MISTKIDLDDPLIKYLSYFEMADERFHAITLRQLLSHTAGMPDPEDWIAGIRTPEYDDEALERYVQGLGDQSLLFEPGSDWAYSSIGFNVLGDVIAKVPGQTFEDYAAENIFRPLGMDNTTFLVKETDPDLLTSPHLADESGQIIVSKIFPYSRVHSPSSTLYSNVEDMARYAMAHLNGGILDGTRILNADNQAKLWTPVTETKFSPDPADTEDRYYGLGWHMGDYKGHRIIGHGGLDPGFNSFLVLIPEQTTAYLLACNYNAGTFPAIILRGPILDALLGIEATTA
ncbi:beta-lactamase family protein [Chloroflexi bacterium TSY]|nr:beta-lactamase family protein [Chloroflexi bacterium TSY]